MKELKETKPLIELNMINWYMKQNNDFFYKVDRIRFNFTYVDGEIWHMNFKFAYLRDTYIIKKYGGTMLENIDIVKWLFGDLINFKGEISENY